MGNFVVCPQRCPVSTATPEAAAPAKPPAAEAAAPASPPAAAAAAAGVQSRSSSRQQPARTVAGPHPVAASSTGRRYYLFLSTQPEPIIAGGSATALARCGTWFGSGRAPEGFADLHSALNAAAAKGHRTARIEW